MENKAPDVISIDAETARGLGIKVKNSLNTETYHHQRAVDELKEKITELESALATVKMDYREERTKRMASQTMQTHSFDNDLQQKLSASEAKCERLVAMAHKYCAHFPSCDWYGYGVEVGEESGGECSCGLMQALRDCGEGE